MTQDKYSVAMDILLSSEDFEREVIAAWSDPACHPAGSLFQFVTRSGRVENGMSGCLTMIHSLPGYYFAGSPELTKAIVDDNRIPSEPECVTRDNLFVFAEWQRVIDEELERV